MVDCNNCKNINITEIQQIDKAKDHICKIYNKRVLHNANTKIHDSYIFPCIECKLENYKYHKESECEE